MKQQDSIQAALLGEVDEPVFSEPWEAHAFALAVKLHEQGHFNWTEWSESLGREIAVGTRASTEDRFSDYYHFWYQALEQLVLSKGMIKSEELVDRQLALTSESDHPDH